MDRYAHLDRDLLSIGTTGTQDRTKVSSRDALRYISSMRKLAMGLPLEQAMVVPAAESPESVVMREQALALAQSQAELQRAAMQNQELQMAAQQAAQQAQEAQQVAQQQEQAAQEAQMQAQQSMELATSAQENAAAQADAKMRLSMRINQMRQNLAALVSSDPVAEEGVGFEEQAGAGAPVTQVQQQQQAAAEQAAAAQAGAEGGAAPPPGAAKAVQEAEEAERAQARAEQQTMQAEQEAQKMSGDMAGSARIQAFLDGQASARARLRARIESFASTSPRKQPSGPGGYAEQLIRGTAKKHPDVGMQTTDKHVVTGYPDGNRYFERKALTDRKVP